MDYIQQLNSFFSELYTNALSPNAICLYVILFHINNKCNWLKDFSVANMTIQGLTGMSRDQLNRARLELIQKGYIQYKKGTGNQCGSYLIVSFATQTATQCATQTAHNVQHNVQHKLDTNCTHYINKTETKLNKTNKEKVKKEKFGEYQHVLLTEKEYQSLKSDFPHTFEELIKYLDEYIEMKGYKAKSHYLAIRKWVINAVEEHRAKVITSSNIPQQQPTAEERAKWAEKVQQELEAKKNAKH